MGGNVKLQCRYRHFFVDEDHDRTFLPAGKASHPRHLPGSGGVVGPGIVGKDHERDRQ
jgi:hypothetical protein